MLIREGLRFLRRNRLLSLCAIAVLATGMAAAGVAIAILLVFSEPGGRGIRMGARATIGDQTGNGPLRGVDWKYIQQMQDKIPEPAVLTAYAPSVAVPLALPGGTRWIRVSAVSRNFFRLFVDPMEAGTAEFDGDAQCPDAPGLILSSELARRLFASPSEAVGQVVRVQGVGFRVTGVSASAFRGLFGDHVDAWIPAGCVGAVYLNLGRVNGFPSANELWKDYPAFYALAAMPAGGDTQELVRRITAAIRSSRSATGVYAGLTADPSRDLKIRSWARLGIILTISLTLASSLSFAGLLVARLTRRIDEARLKRALGATPMRLIAELSGGPLLLVLLASICAAVLLLMALTAVGNRLGISGAIVALSGVKAAEVVAWESALAASIGVVMALIPALRLVRDSGAPRMAYTATARKGPALLLDWIVAGQVAFSMVTLIVAAMVAGTVYRISHRPPGFQTEHRTVLVIAVPERTQTILSYSDEGPFPLVNAAEQIRRKLSGLPGVNRVALALRAPLDQPAMSLKLRPALGTGDTERSVAYNAVSRDYFPCLGTVRVSGPGFSTDSLTGTPGEAIVTRSLASELWPPHSAVGKTITAVIPATGLAVRLRVTGVVEDMHNSDPAESAQPTVFLPFRGGALAGVLPWYVIIDGTQPASLLEGMVNAELANQLPGFAVVHSYSLQHRMADRMAPLFQKQRFALAGSVAIALVAWMGVYSALRYYVSANQRELAIRMCYGATRARVRWIVIARAIRTGAAAMLLSFAVWPALARLTGATVLGAAWSGTLAGAVTLGSFALVIVVSLAPAEAAARISLAKRLRDE